ncbi:MAG: hypothetical protein LBI16_03395 [Burkholderiales bacterium]|nr:hypothetical protein [Burkholderiales bacterium]
MSASLPTLSSTAPDFSPPPQPLLRQEHWAWVAFALIVALGLALRLDQFVEQVLIEDEWHAVHRILSFSAAETFRTFGHSDHCIPLTLLYGWIADHVGLSETLMRAPMMAAGALLLLLFPWYIARRLGWPTALLFALFLAISPLLISYSRMARPFALTVFLGWLAHAAFLHFWAAATARQAILFGTGYVTSAALAIWLHLIIAPFVAAPFLWGLWQLFRSPDKNQRKTWFLRSIVLAASFAVALVALIALPLISDLEALSSKSGTDLPNKETLKGALYFWTGTTQTWAMVVCAVFMIPGIFSVCRLPIVRTGLLGIALTLIGILLTRPSWVFVSVTFTRYLLPLLPLLLLFLAAGCLQNGQLLQRKFPFLRRKTWMIAAVPLTAMVLASPLHQILRVPNSNSLDYFHVLDYRPWLLPHQMRNHNIRASSFWSQRATLPAASERIALAPFSFESDKWPATPLEALSKQRVIPAFLNGFCNHHRSGELLDPNDKRFRFRNASFLTDIQMLRDHRLDWIVWQKNFPDLIWQEIFPGRKVPWDSTDMPACEVKWRTTFGTPDYEDEFLMAYRVKNL